jgi:membrane protease YdiL (CAAX protease family)
MFAVYHFQPFNVIPLIILGWFLGFVVYYSNSIYTGIVCHFLNNFFASYFLFVYGKDEFKTPEVSGSELPDTIIMTVFSIILFAALVFLFYKFRFKEEAAEA